MMAKRLAAPAAWSRTTHGAAAATETPGPHPQGASPHSKTPEPRIRVLLVDDHPVVRRGIRSCLGQARHIEVVGEAADGVEALCLAKERWPDVVLTDIDMPQMTGLTLAEALRREVPDTHVLILTMHANTDYVLRIIQSGAKGYVLKDAQAAELILAVNAVHRGDAFFSPDVARLALNQFVRGAGGSAGAAELTPREREVLVGVAEGLSNKEIAVRLGLGVRTVESHRENLMTKLNIHSVAGLTKFAVGRGLVSLEAGVEAPLAGTR